MIQRVNNNNQKHNKVAFKALVKMKAPYFWQDLEDVLVAYKKQSEITPKFKYLQVYNGMFESIIATGEHLPGLQKHLDTLASITDQLKELVGLPKESKANLYDLAKQLNKLKGESATKHFELSKQQHELHQNYIRGLGELPIVDAAEAAKAISANKFDFENSKILA